jgi:O-antigen ligase
MRVIARTAGLPSLGRKKIEGTGASWGLIFMLLYAAVSVGRIQELIPALAPMRLGLITGGLALFVWLKAPGSLAEKIPIAHPVVRDVMILLGLGLLTIPLGVWPGHSLEFLVGVYLKTVLLFLLVIYWCRSLDDVRRLLWVCCVAVAILVVPGVIAGQDELERYQGETLSYDPNDLALLFVVTLPFILYLYSTSGRKARMVLVGLAMLCLYGMVLTRSRGGMLALVVVGGLILSRSRLSRSAKWNTVAAAVIVFGILAGTAWKERIATIWDPQTEYDRTAGGRTDIWQTGLMVLLTHPWGVGIDGFVTAEGNYHGGAGKWNTAHNSFLQVAVELGVAGLLVFIRLLVETMKSIRRIEFIVKPPSRAGPGQADQLPLWRQLKKRSKGPGDDQGLFQLSEAMEISIWGFLVAGFFLSQAYNSMLYIMLALAVVCLRFTQDVSSGAATGTQRWRLLPPVRDVRPRRWKAGG